MKLFAKFDYSTPKFIHYHEVPHLLVEVHLVPLHPVQLGLLLGGPQWNVVVLGPEMYFPQVSLLTSHFLSFFIYFYEIHHLLVEVHLVPLLTVHLGLQDGIW